MFLNSIDKSSYHNLTQNELEHMSYLVRQIDTL